MAGGRHANALSRIPSASIPARPGAALSGAWALLDIWVWRNRQRHALADLDDRLLSDIGLTREDARRECAKRFWRG